MIWFISDLHISHEAILTHCSRPFANVEEMNETLVRNWNECVKPNDTVYVLGDLTLAPFKEVEPIVKRLNGINKILVLGNHDKFSVGQYNKLGFTVYHEIKMKIAGQIVRLSHYPYKPSWWRRLFCYKSELRFMEKRPPKIKGEWLLHGHSHVKYKKADKGQRIHVGVDAWDFRPCSIREIESLMNRKEE